VTIAHNSTLLFVQVVTHATTSRLSEKRCRPSDRLVVQPRKPLEILLSLIELLLRQQLYRSSESPCCSYENAPEARSSFCNSVA